MRPIKTLILLSSLVLLQNTSASLRNEKSGGVAAGDSAGLAIVLIGSHMLDCTFCSDSVAEILSRLADSQGHTGIIGFVVPDHPLQLKDSAYKIMSRQTAGLSFKNNENIPFFLLTENIFHTSQVKAPIVLHAKVTNTLHFPDPLIERDGETHPARFQKVWIKTVHSGLFQLFLLLTALMILAGRYTLYRLIGRQLGERYVVWFPGFNPSLKEGRFRLFAGFIGVCAGLFLLISAPALWTLSLIVTLILLAFAMNACSMIQVGERGVNINLHYLS
jgi:hypothetical protein